MKSLKCLYLLSPMKSLKCLYLLSREKGRNLFDVTFLHKVLNGVECGCISVHRAFTPICCPTAMPC